MEREINAHITERLPPYVGGLLRVVDDGSSLIRVFAAMRCDYQDRSLDGAPATHGVANA